MLWKFWQHYKFIHTAPLKSPGGDSGIGRAVAALFAMEGADVGITYVAGDEDKDAEDTVKLVGEVSQGKRKATKYAADLGFDENCKKVIDDFLKDHKRIDILVSALRSI
jgi:NAD(P)-dependent dehydrogenase (short-subunit alcohol dehydrogenase family)